MGNIAEWSERRPQVEAATHLSVRISLGLQTEAENTSSVRNSQMEDHLLNVEYKPQYHK